MEAEEAAKALSNIGMDVGLQDTCQRSLCALVGCSVYKTCCAIPFAEWMRSHWTSICGYVPYYLTLTYGSFQSG